MSFLLVVARNRRLISAVLSIPLMAAAPPELRAAGKPEDSRSMLPPVVKLESSRKLTLKEFRVCVEEKKCLILDARAAKTFQAGHVPGALLFSEEEFDVRYAQLKSKLEKDRSQKIVIYCASLFCESSGIVQKKLIELGFTGVYLFPYGWAAWQKARLPEEMGELAATSGT